MSQRIHMVGIGGIGMSALARLLLARGAVVSGSDANRSHITDALSALGAAVTIGHRAELVAGAARVVISDAIKDGNPELQRARELRLPVQRRSQLLAELAGGYRLIAVAGTHGKTTVTAMLGLILVESGLDPVIVLGGEYAPFGGNLRIGKGEWMVAEACEAYESFLDLQPELAVITNIEADHLDHHGTEEHLRQAFADFLSHLRPGGTAVLCADRSELHRLAARARSKVVWYGTRRGDVRGEHPQSGPGGGRCELYLEGQPAGELAVGVPGLHNLTNALGALAAARAAGADVGKVRGALAEFRGVGRRFDVLGEAGGATVIDDYAHHPTELAATLAAARTAFPGRRLLAVFQPHLYSRTRDFAKGFARALEAADLVVLTDIYPAREAPLPGVTSALIAGPLRAARGEGAVLEVAKQEVVKTLAHLVQPGDVVLMMGAGDIGELAHQWCAQATGPHGEREA